MIFFRIRGQDMNALAKKTHWMGGGGGGGGLWDSPPPWNIYHNGRKIAPTTPLTYHLKGLPWSFVKNSSAINSSRGHVLHSLSFE
jgi:hypothetical protein